MENDNVNINLELNVNEVNVILTALRELPHRFVNDLINKIVNQGQAQIQPEKKDVQ